ncbi:MAG TPA: DNA primase [bacterium]
MPLIPDSVIDEIQSRTDIAELIGRYVPLKRAGRHFKAHCPFHKERTPSFVINQDKQIFHCFGCGAGGNIFGFLMRYERLTFPEAVRQLADQLGVRLPEHAGEVSEVSARILQVLETACGWFERVLAGEAGREASAYIERRGVPQEARGRFRLGLARDGWDHLLTAAGAKGVSAQQLEAAGLALRGRAGHYDRFRQRLIFPILDIRGRVVGFGGRALDDQEPKYLNSPETAVYSKGRHLFGLCQSRDSIAREGRAVVVEGYFDCVVLSGAGLECVVSPLGTALTTDQAKLLKRYAEHVILAFDPDAAGDQAAWRGADVLVELGLRVSVAQLPAGKDPDEVVQESGRAGLERILERAVPLIDFLIETAKARHPGGAPEHKVRAAHLVLPTVAKIGDAILRREYVKRLADRLGLDEGAVMEELRKQAGRGRAGDPAVAALPPVRRPPRAGAERLLAALVLEDPSCWDRVRAEIRPDDLTDAESRAVLELADVASSESGGATPARLLSRLAAQGRDADAAELLALAESVAAKPEALEECIRRIQAGTRRRELERLDGEIRAAQDAGADERVYALLAEYQRQVKGG